jgi:hypothetical protein
VGFGVGLGVGLGVGEGVPKLRLEDWLVGASGEEKATVAVKKIPANTERIMACEGVKTIRQLHAMEKTLQLSDKGVDLPKVICRY